MGKAAVIMWCRKKFFKYWRVLVPALLLAALCRPGPGPAAEAGGGGSVTVPEEPPLVALTFDDGPRTSTTSRLLDGLALREIQATFFLVGDRIQGQETLVRRMAEDGHQIGVHSYDHSCISDLSRGDFDLQVGRTRGVLSAVLGSGDFWLRPPYGIIDDAGLRWAGSPVVLWSVDPEDWKDQDTGRVVGSVLSHVEDGSIILLHDIYDSSVDAALQIADALSGQGYCFVTVEQLLQAKGIQPQDGTVYRCAK